MVQFRLAGLDLLLSTYAATRRGHLHSTVTPVIRRTFVSLGNSPVRSRDAFCEQIYSDARVKKYLWMKLCDRRRLSIDHRHLAVNGDLDVGMVRGDRAIYRDGAP
jgi:hypothetical protein